MPPGRHLYALAAVFVAASSLSAAPQTPCSATAIPSAAAKVADIQHRLASIKIEDMDTDVPAAIQQDTVLLKQSLAAAAQTILACQPANATPLALQTALAKALSANAPDPGNAAHLWGGDLRVSVQPTTVPHLLNVQMSFAIECGRDTMLILFAPEQNHWSQKLLWQSPQYKDDSGAFGNFFLNAILPGKSPGDWRLVVAHGRPWCTSRLSGFDIDVLAPALDPAHPHLLWHTERAYSRGDFNPTLRASGDTFELRLHADEMSFDLEHGYERAVIYRYRLSGNTVTRIEPIATTGRGFVEEWLSMPWSEAKDQSLPASTGALQRVHQSYEDGYPANSRDYTSWTAGPVHSCSAPSHFQIAFSSQFNRFVLGKPGGEQGPPVPIYFQIAQLPNGYEMKSVSSTPDPSCTSPDLMAKPAPAKP